MGCTRKNSVCNFPCQNLQTCEMVVQSPEACLAKVRDAVSIDERNMLHNMALVQWLNTCQNTLYIVTKNNWSDYLDTFWIHDSLQIEVSHTQNYLLYQKD